MSSENGAVKSVTAYEMIREMILTGEALPGTRLVLADLEERLGVGRGPIRDALMRLDKSGLVQNLPYKGAVVTIPPSCREMEHIYALRAQAEVALALEAMNEATEEEIAHLEALAHAMIAEDSGSMSFFKDREFHSYLYSMSKLRHLQSTVEHLMDYVGIFLNFHKHTVDDIQLYHQQHMEIIRALRTKDEALLRKTLQDNIYVGLTVVQKKFQV